MPRIPAERKRSEVRPPPFLHQACYPVAGVGLDDKLFGKEPAPEIVLIPEAMLKNDAWSGRSCANFNALPGMQHMLKPLQHVFPPGCRR